MTSTHPELQNWAGGTLKPIKLTGMNSRFSKNSQKGTGTKLVEKLNNFETFERTQRPPDDWPDALDLLAIRLVLVSNKYTKLGKTSKNLLLSQGLASLHQLNKKCVKICLL